MTVTVALVVANILFVYGMHNGKKVFFIFHSMSLFLLLCARMQRCSTRSIMTSDVQQPAECSFLAFVSFPDQYSMVCSRFEAKTNTKANKYSTCIRLISNNKWIVWVLQTKKRDVCMFFFFCFIEHKKKDFKLIEHHVHLALSLFLSILLANSMRIPALFLFSIYLVFKRPRTQNERVREGCENSVWKTKAEDMSEQNPLEKWSIKSFFF